MPAEAVNKNSGFMPGPEESVFAEELEDCQPVWRLSMIKKTLEAEQSPVMRKVFAYPLPAVVLVLELCRVPNFILAFIPAQINGNTLNTMTAFATGGLLSDVFLHLIPHAFMGEHHGDGVQFVMVEEKRNILIGILTCVRFPGWASSPASRPFLLWKRRFACWPARTAAKGTRTHTRIHNRLPTASGVSKGSENGSAHSRKGKKSDTKEEEHEEPTAKSVTGPSKMSAYLNLFGDFVHNMMAASFYASPLIGATTTLACFAHEIPHEIADYSILIRSGFTKRQAMQSQFVTAIGAFVTFIGIAVASGSAAGQPHSDRHDLAAGVRQDASGLLGTTYSVGRSGWFLPSGAVIPFVAGGFLYIGAVAVLPTWVLS
ncbi:ZIP-like iron-zinc transporter [Mycena amicta]|nr:ZIP-like iron-zinc transporter [Mycena amicta]